MPIYEYRCQRGHTFEVMQRMSDDPVVSCESCEAPVQRVFHPVAVHFKGSGFYNTDYGTRNRAREKGEGSSGSESGSDSKSSGDKKSGGESGSKSESKSESKASTASSASSAAD